MSNVFVTSSGADYNKAWIFPTLGMLSCRVVCLLDETDDRPLPPSAERVVFGNDRFYQHGSFLDYIPNTAEVGKWTSGPLRDSDVVILADADAVIQRDLNAEELDTLANLGDAVWAGPNNGPKQLGCEELDSQKLLVPIDRAAAAFRLSPASMRECPMFNWGLVAAKVSTWRHLRERYQYHTQGVDPQSLFAHVCWMQYLLCATLHHDKIPTRTMPYTMHSHAHFGLHPNVHGVKNQRLYANYGLCFYAHFCLGVTHFPVRG